MSSVKTNRKSINPGKQKRLPRKNDERAGIGDNSGIEPEKVVDTEFAKTIAAAKDIERSQWTLAYALVEECGAPSQPGEHTGSDEKLEQAQAALEAVGCDYSIGHLRAVRRTGARFSIEERSSFDEAIPFTLFMIAGTPEKLRTAVEKAKKGGVKLTAQFIRATLKDQDEVDVAFRLAGLNEELERANAADKAFEKEKSGISRLSEQERAQFFNACKLVEGKWSKIAARFQPIPEQTTDTEHAADTEKKAA